MSCHVYKFGGKTYLQQPHGCIGDEAIGVIANIIMIWWSRKFKAKLDELNIRNDLLKLYVDDINGTFGVIEKGTQFENGRLQFSKEKEERDETIPEDEVTMQIICQIANTIENMISMTYDVPSKHEDHRVPMLDLKVWLNKEDNEKIYYCYYEKPTKCPFVMSKESAMPTSKKIEFLSQETFRRLHNTKKEIAESEKVEILN